MGLRLLAEHGARQLTIQALCESMRRTKGSFYHHFDGFADFKTELLYHFEQQGTLQIIEAVEQEPTPEAKLRRLIDVVVESSRQVDCHPEVAIRAWALHDDEVHAVQQRVDAKRLDYLEALCDELVTENTRARRMARLLYLIEIGSEQIHPSIHSDALRTLFDEYLDLYNIPPYA